MNPVTEHVNVAELLARLMTYAVTLLIAGMDDTEEYYAAEELIAQLLPKAVQA